MGVQLDLIIPPVIVGLLVILIFRMNAFVLETSADNRLIGGVQTNADVAIDIIQEELRGLQGDLEISEDTLQFDKYIMDAATNPHPFMIVRDDNNQQLKVHFQDVVTSVPDSIVYDFNLSSLDFTITGPDILRVRVEAESRPDQHVRFRNDVETVRAVTERDIFLRNRAMPPD